MAGLKPHVVFVARGAAGSDAASLCRTDCSPLCELLETIRESGEVFFTDIVDYGCFLMMIVVFTTGCS